MKPPDVVGSENGEYCGLNIPSKFLCWRSNPQCDGFWRWAFGRELGLHELMSVRLWSSGISTFRDPKELPFSLSLPCEHTVIRWPSGSQEEEPHQNPTTYFLIHFCLRELPVHSLQPAATNYQRWSRTKAWGREGFLWSAHKSYCLHGAWWHPASHSPQQCQALTSWNFLKGEATCPLS